MSNYSLPLVCCQFNCCCCRKRVNFVIRFSADHWLSLSSVCSVKKKNSVVIICLLAWAQHWLLIIRLLFSRIKNIEMEHTVLLFWFILPICVCMLKVSRNQHNSDHENPDSFVCVRLISRRQGSYLISSNIQIAENYTQYFVQAFEGLNVKN